jgi:hypothetical protein
VWGVHTRIHTHTNDSIWYEATSNTFCPDQSYTSPPPGTKRPYTCKYKGKRVGKRVGKAKGKAEGNPVDMAVGKAVGKGIGAFAKASPEHQAAGKARSKAMKGTTVICVCGKGPCTVKASKWFRRHFKVRQKCFDAVEAIIANRDDARHDDWKGTRRKWLL